jgi:hypothetical protein
MYTLNISTSNFIKQRLLVIKAQKDTNTNIVDDFNIPLPPIDRTHTQINNATSELNNTVDQVDLTDICRIFHPTSAKYILLLAAYRTLSKNRSYFRTQCKS